MTQGRQRATKGDNFLINAKKSAGSGADPAQCVPAADVQGTGAAAADVRRIRSGGDVAGEDMSSTRGPFRSGSML